MEAKRLSFSLAFRISAVLAAIYPNVFSFTTAAAYTEDEAALYLHVLRMEFPHCLLDGLSVTSEKLGTPAATNAVECQDHCMNEANCDVFAFNSAASSCTLASMSKYTSHGAGNGISGPKQCKNLCVQEGAVKGTVVRVIADGSVSTLKECLNLCVNSEPCAVASFDYLSDVCTLVGKNTGEIAMKRGVFSAAKRCGYRDSSVMMDMAMEGSSLIKEFQTETWAKCRSMGRNVAGCAYWSWSAETQMCVLLNAAAITTLKTQQGSLTGPTWSEQAGCFVADTRTPEDANSSKMYAMSKEHCRLLCQQTQKCVFMSYHKQSGVCQLTNSDSKSTAATDEAGWVSGPAICSPRNWCLMPDIALYGGTIADVRLPDIDTCRERCRATADCHVFGYNTNNAMCSSMRLAALNTPKPLSGVISSFASCGSLNACQVENQDFGESQHLEDVADIADAETCGRTCFDQPRCFHYSLLGGGTCRLYPKMSQARQSEGSVGGHAEC